jgi:hypothetical protein
MAEAPSKTRITKNLSIIDEGFVRNRTANFHLSLQLGFDGLSYCVFDIKANRYLAMESYAFQGIHNPAALAEALHELVEGSEVLKNIYKSVQAGIINERSTLIPNAVFEKGRETDYLKFNHFLGKEDVVKVYDLKGLEARNIFAIPIEVVHALEKHFPNVKFNHHSSALLEGLLTSYKNQPEQRIFVHVQASHFELVALKEKELFFYNSFRHQASEDFIYYLLYVCEQLKLNPETAELVLLGEVERNSAIYSIIYKYVRHVRFGARNEIFSYARGFTDIPDHFHYNLLNQFLCA